MNINSVSDSEMDTDSEMHQDNITDAAHETNVEDIDNDKT